MTGLAGIIVPIIPSIPLIWLGTFFYGLFTHFEKITWLTLAILAVVTIASIVFENLANIYGAKKFERYAVGYLRVNHRHGSWAVSGDPLV